MTEHFLRYHAAPMYVIVEQSHLQRMCGHSEAAECLDGCRVLGLWPLSDDVTNACWWLSNAEEIRHPNQCHQSHRAARDIRGQDQSSVQNAVICFFSPHILSVEKMIAQDIL